MTSDLIDFSYLSEEDLNKKLDESKKNIEEISKKIGPLLQEYGKHRIIMESIFNEFIKRNKKIEI